MNQKPRKTHLLLGSITSAWSTNSTAPRYHHTPFWTLFVQVKNISGSYQTKVYVFPQLVPPAIISTLETQTYQGKTYFLECEKRVRGWRLRDWKEISESSG